MEPPKKKTKITYSRMATRSQDNKQTKHHASAASKETGMNEEGATAKTTSPPAATSSKETNITDENGEEVLAAETIEVQHTASDKVLSTTELLEMILLGLDNKTLFLIQRVSKTFRTTIKDSLAIQQALFLKPSMTMDFVLNDFAFPQIQDIFFRDKSQLLMHEHGDYWWVSHSTSRDPKDKIKNPHLWPMLLRQPATDLSILVGCGCGFRTDSELKAGSTFGDLIRYLEEDFRCDCTGYGSDDDTSE